MHLNKKKTSLLILGITAIACSRAMFWFFNDPEGPNVLIVMVMAVIVYVVSLAAYLSYPLANQSGLRKILIVIFIQMLMVAGLYFGLN